MQRVGLGLRRARRWPGPGRLIINTGAFMRGTNRDILLVRIAWLLAPAAVGSCALMTAAPPQVEIRDVRLSGLGVLDQTLAVTLCVTNPNATELDFRSVAVKLDLGGTDFADGASQNPIPLAPHSSREWPFTVATTIRNLGPQLLGILQTGQIDYRLHGTVQLAGGFAMTVPFSRTGRLGLLDAGPGLLADATDPVQTRCGGP